MSKGDTKVVRSDDGKLESIVEIDRKSEAGVDVAMNLLTLGFYGTTPDTLTGLTPDGRIVSGKEVNLKK